MKDKRGKMIINDPRINGIELLLRKFPIMTKRQVWGIYDQAVRDGLSYEEIATANIEIKFPGADIGETFGITITVKKK